MHSCHLLDSGEVRCWGLNDEGQLGLGHTENVGDDETPGSAPTIDFGVGRTAVEVSAGGSHSCAILDDGGVRCWGRGLNGQLGYGNTETIGDDESPATVGPVDLGPGRTAVAVSAGGFNSCAILDTGSVRCWGVGSAGRVGSGNEENIGDDETPGSVPAVDLGAGRTATRISVGNEHTCALLDNGDVRCWGTSRFGQLGYGNQSRVGDDETPGEVGPVELGPGRTAVDIAAGESHTCAILDSEKVRCWGNGAFGQLGYGNTQDIGDDEAPAAAGPVKLGAAARQIIAGGLHSCALLEKGRVRCWGYGANGQLGYGNTKAIGDDEHPREAGPLALGGKARSLSGGWQHNCAQLRSGEVRCWGWNPDGQLGLGHTRDVGHRTPAELGPVHLQGPIPTRLTLDARPDRDRDRPYAFRASGHLKGPFPGGEENCQGQVRLVLRDGSDALDRVEAPLEPAAEEGCAYEATLRSNEGGELRLEASFEGNPGLAAARNRTRVRAG